MRTLLVDVPAIWGDDQKNTLMGSVVGDESIRSLLFGDVVRISQLPSAG